MNIYNPKIVVIGAGALGGLIGGLLAEGGLDVTLIDVNKAHMDVISDQGLNIIGFGGDRFIPIHATTDASTVGTADIAIIQCKAMHTEEAITKNKSVFSDHTTVVSFQNGIGNEEVIAALLGEERVVGGLSALGSIVEAPGVIRNYSELPTYIGELFGVNADTVSPRVKEIALAFSNAGLPTHASSNIREIMWKKLLGNIGLSAPSGATNMTAADMMEIPELASTIERALDEAAAVAAATGVKIPDEEKRQVLDKLTDRDGGNGNQKSSLCIDLLSGRPTEIDRLYGTVSKLGVKHGVATPTLDTLIGIIRGMEST